MSAPAPSHKPRYNIALLFSGHMIDAPDRTEPRIPPALEPLAAAAIRSWIATFPEAGKGSIIGIASGARGGDILFHEGCEALGVPTVLVLPFGIDAFLARSVRGVTTGGWESRFTALWQRLAPHRRIILDGADAADPFGSCNNAMIEIARRMGKTVQLGVLWDGAESGKLGGTGAFVEEVREAGGHITLLDTKSLLARLTSGEA